ncbi:MAG TPA: phage tail protein [Myxococcales bacterium]|nr:phage tail protein [Deltaproteobacteria bacterium]MBU49640.1 phage tail protein [Deltaproteobacteria bacterium]HAA58481.1 phage tail protein [Myxococcales bacterium]|tara:strand:+ start:19128 stop:19715 length:588 start_codon:yes stop_codon:yes gene_type:complete
MDTISHPSLILTARQFGLYKAFKEAFSEVKGVEISDKDIMQLENINAVVSPANSYGWMDGGIDQVYVYSFGQQIEERVKQQIKQDHGGELPVGSAFVIETYSERIEYLVVAPTMRIPGPVKETQNAYLAMKAMLKAVYQFNQTNAHVITGIGCPGLGTGTGGIPYKEAARQMRRAFLEANVSENIRLQALQQKSS